MNTERDLQRSLQSWLHEDRHEDAERVLDTVMAQLDTTPQRRPSWLAQRTPEMNKFVAFGLTAAAVVLIAVIGIQLIGSPNVVGPPVETPTPASTSSPAPLSVLPDGIMPAGTYLIDPDFPVPFSITVPDGYEHHGSAGLHDRDGIPAAHGLEFQRALNVYPDPCQWELGPANPPVGGSVDDLVTAMTNLVGFTAGPVADMTIGGQPVRVFDLTNDLDPTICDQGTYTFQFLDGTKSGVGPGELQRIYVMDVSHVRFMIMTYYFSTGNATEDAQMVEELQGIVDSIEFR